MGHFFIWCLLDIYACTISILLVKGCRYLYIAGNIWPHILMQSGKSAAIYACAKEQGFHVIEVALTLLYSVVGCWCQIVVFTWTDMHKCRWNSGISSPSQFYVKSCVYCGISHNKIRGTFLCLCFLYNLLNAILFNGFIVVQLDWSLVCRQNGLNNNEEFWLGLWRGFCISFLVSTNSLMLLVLW